MKKKKLTRHKKEGVAAEPKKKSVRLVHSSLGTIWVLTDKILMAKSERHKVKVLAVAGKNHEWCERNCSLDEFLLLLSDKKFERVNKFYLLNWLLTLGFNHKKKLITFTTGFSCELNHQIKPSVFKERFL
jgi:hypothetical protein